MDRKEDNDMGVVLNNKSKKKLSEHPNYKAEVPRLDVVKGVVHVNPDNPLHRKWFEEFKK